MTDIWLSVPFTLLLVVGFLLRGLSSVLSRLPLAARLCLCQQVTRILKYQDVAGVSDVVMKELETYLFGSIGGANQSAWSKLRNTYEQYLREWWVETPEDPWVALRSGIWKTLLRLYSDQFVERVRGNDRVGTLMNKLIFDDTMTLISRWTDADHIRIMKMRSSSDRESALKRLQHFQSSRAMMRGAAGGRTH